MVLLVLWLADSYKTLGESTVTCDKRFKRILKKSDLQKAKLTIIVIIATLLVITTIIDFFAKK